MTRHRVTDDLMESNFTTVLSQKLLSGRALTVLASVFLLAGCEQMQTPGYYDPPRASTTTDAARQAQSGGSRGFVHAPHQVQIQTQRGAAPAKSRDAAGSPASESTTGAQAAAEASVELAQALLPQVQTYHGTLPCFHKEMRCTNQQITLTLAPNGRWRARAKYAELDASTTGKGFLAQGCWRLVPTSPPNLILLDSGGNLRAEMQFPHRNTLRLKTIDGETPNLVYTLSRQPDLDPISELDQTPALNCN